MANAYLHSHIADMQERFSETVSERKERLEAAGPSEFWAVDEARRIAASVAELPELLDAQDVEWKPRQWAEAFPISVEAKFVTLPVFLPDPICCLVVPEPCFGPG
jgi:hypothetical protein